MSITLHEKPTISLANKLPVAARFATLRSWLLCWEMYPIVFVAAFLRLYQFNTTEFERDMPDLFGMARYAVTHGMIPVTSNLASIGIYNPPATVEIFMIPAAFSNDPLWTAMTVAILMIVSVLLTYGFVRYYYGRIAATIAALMYATLLRAVVYSRFIWNTNLLPLFAILFIMALFWGAVARRKGWLPLALFLFGILTQLHATAGLLIIPLGITLVLAPGTIHRRDLALGLLSFLITYFPYILWEFAVHFFDVHILVQTFLHPQQVAFNDEAWILYQTLMNPYDLLSITNPFHWSKNIVPYLDESSMLWKLAPYLSWISQMLVYLIVTSMATTLVLAVWSWGSSSHERQTGKITAWGHVRRYWSDLRNSPYRCGLIVLLCWQMVPLLILLRHSILLYQHYFLFLLPGPFILVGIFLAKTSEWLGNGRKTAIPQYIQRYGVYATLAGLILVAQLIGGILDVDRGHSPTTFMANPLQGLLITDILMTVSVLLTYGFVRCHANRVAATIAALMYAILFRAAVYSPVIFVVFFFMALFWGVVAHRKGWLIPALFLLCISIQLQVTENLRTFPFHNTVALTIIPLGIALILARRTLRWRDLPLGLLSFLIISLPYFLGEISLVVVCIVTTLVLAVWPWGSSSHEKQTDLTGWGHVRRYWSRLGNPTSRHGLIMLFCWQLMPIIILLCHSDPLYQQYLIFLLPGPCILSGIFLTKTAEGLWSGERMMVPWFIRRYGMYALAGLIIIAQFIGSTLGVLDIDRGHYSNGFYEPGYPTYDLRFFRTALTKADQLAQQHHLNRVYIAADWSTQDQLDLLSPQMHTPVIIFSSNCAVLPSTSEGPAVLLVGPYSYLTIDLIMQFAKVTLIGKPMQVGGASFLLYIVTPKPEQAVSPPLLEDGLQHSVSGHYYDHIPWLVTSWRLMRSALPDYRTEYKYTMKSIPHELHQQSTTTECTFSAMRAGDQVLIPFYQDNLSTDNHPATTSTISVNGRFRVRKPLYLHDGPLTLLNFATTDGI